MMNIDRDADRNVPMHEKVFRQLSDELMQGRFAPGQKLSLRQIGETLGTSTAPVREAVQRLSVMGALTIYPQRYIFVPHLTAEKYIEILEIRSFLEGRAVRKACENMCTDEIAELVTINNQLMSNVEANKLSAAMRENQRFLFHIYRSARSDILLEMIESLWLLVGPTLNKHLIDEFNESKKTLKLVFGNHSQIIAALKAKDADAAVAAKEADLHEGAQLIIASLRRQEEEMAASESNN